MESERAKVVGGGGGRRELGLCKPGATLSFAAKLGRPACSHKLCFHLIFETGAVELATATRAAAAACLCLEQASHLIVVVVVEILASLLLILQN